MEVERLQSLCKEPLVGYHLESVVGIRHATGANGIRPGDTLSLIREPDNPYDACAVRVDREGAKVGYVRGAFAKRLAVVMDNAMDQNDAVNANVSVRCMALDTPDEYDVKVALAYYTHEASHGLNGILRVEQLDTSSRTRPIRIIYTRPSNHTKKPSRRTRRPTGTFHSSRPSVLPWKPARRSTSRSGRKVP